MLEAGPSVAYNEGGGEEKGIRRMGYENLLSPCNKLSQIPLKHRVVMSAMTRLRTDPETEAPVELNRLYYAQRASPGGLIISECAAISHSSRGYIRAPGVFTGAQLQGWKLVTDAVHEKGAFIFCQIFHAGRVTHSSIVHPHRPVAPSPVAPSGYVHTKNGKMPYDEPLPLTIPQIQAIVSDFASAAKNAVAAGFDGIELHAGNGYLIQEFLAQKTNLRTDEYGGSVENRARFLLELVDACCEAVGSNKVAVKLQQGVTFSDLVEPEEDSLAQLAYLGPQLEQRNLAYVCMSSLNYEPYYKYVGLEKPNFQTDVFRFFKQHYKGTIMINGGLSPEKAEEYIAEGIADLAAFAVLFIPNANLPELLACNGEIDYAGGWDAKIWYSKDPATDVHGYTDWPLKTPTPQT